MNETDKGVFLSLRVGGRIGRGAPLAPGCALSESMCGSIRASCAVAMLGDHHIRNRIRDCALFVPIISSHTQSRPEGYFRLEWDLAEQRSHMITRSKAFIVPVCIDQTSEARAEVPELVPQGSVDPIARGCDHAGFMGEHPKAVGG